MDYEPDKSRYFVEEEPTFSQIKPFNWVYSKRYWSWPTSNGECTFCIEKQTEPFGPWKVVLGTTKGNI